MVRYMHPTRELATAMDQVSAKHVLMGISTKHPLANSTAPRPHKRHVAVPIITEACAPDR